MAIDPSELRRLRRLMRANAREWAQSFYRHDVLMARSVRGAQINAGIEFDRALVRPLLREIAASLSDFDPRGSDIVIDQFPQLQALRNKMQQIIGDGMRNVRSASQGQVERIIRQDSQFVAKTAEKLLGSRPPVASIAEVRQIQTSVPVLGRKVEEWFESELAGDIGNKTRAWITTGLQRGLTTDEIVRGLKGRKATNYTDGILSGFPRHTVTAIVRTSATAASAQIRQRSFEALGATSWKFVATLDTRTTIQCAANDGKVFPVGEGPVPPLHPNCRSTVLPDFGDEEIGNRASMDGPVPADQSFEDWLGDQSEARQNVVLGRTKAAAWRAGDLSLQQMLGPDLEPLSIEELERLERL